MHIAVSVYLVLVLFDRIQKRLGSLSHHIRRPARAHPTCSVHLTSCSNDPTFRFQYSDPQREAHGRFVEIYDGEGWTVLPVLRSDP